MSQKQIYEDLKLPKIANFYKKNLLGWKEQRISIKPVDIRTRSPGDEIKYTIKYSSPQSVNMYQVYPGCTWHKTKISLTGATGGYLDGSSNSCIRKISELGAILVSEYDKCNVMQNVQTDFTVTDFQRNNYWSQFGMGSQGNNFKYGIHSSGQTETVGLLRGYLASNTTLNTKLKLMYGTGIANSNASAEALGDILWAGLSELTYNKMNNNTSLGQFIVGGEYLIAAQMIHSSMIGTLAQSLYPISETYGYDLTMTLETSNNAFVGNQTTFTMSNNELFLTLIEYSVELTNLIRDITHKEFIIPTVGIKNYAWQFSNLADTSSSFTWNIPCNLLNATGLLIVFRPSENYTVGSCTLSQRAKLGIFNYNLSIGGRQVNPGRGIEMDELTGLSDPEGFMETCKFFGNDISSMTPTGNVSAYSYNQDIQSTISNQTTTKKVGHFAIGYNLQGLFNEEEENYRSATTLNAMDTIFTFYNKIGLATNVNVDCFITYEMDLLIQEGLLYAFNDKTFNTNTVNENIIPPL